MQFYDFHIHTEYSGCSRKHGRYSYNDVADHIRNVGLDGFGVSDHCNYRAYKPNFLKIQKEQQKLRQLEDTGLVGLEVTILNRKGDLGLHPRYRKLVDYIIISEHSHIAKIGSEFYNTKKKVRSWIEKDYLQYLPRIEDIIKKLVELQVKGISRNSRSILAHVFHFPFNLRIVPPIIYEQVD